MSRRWKVDNDNVDDAGGDVDGEVDDNDEVDDYDNENDVDDYDCVGLIIRLYPYLGPGLQPWSRHLICKVILWQCPGVFELCNHFSKFFSL